MSELGEARCLRTKGSEGGEHSGWDKIRILPRKKESPVDKLPHLCR